MMMVGTVTAAGSGVVRGTRVDTVLVPSDVCITFSDVLACLPVVGFGKLVAIPSAVDSSPGLKVVTLLKIVV